MKIFKLIFTTLLFFNTLLIADNGSNDSCSRQELITPLNNISSSVNNVNNNGELKSGFWFWPGDDDDYYYFKPSIDGTVSIEYTSSRDTSLYVSTSSCGSNRVLNSARSYNNNISVSSNQTVYIRVQRRSSGTTTYGMKLSFTIANLPPLVNAGPDVSATLALPITITGTATDSDGTIASREWRENGALLATTASFSYTPTSNGAHTLVFKATDNKGLSASDEMIVTASLAAAPQLSDEIFSIQNTVTSGTRIGTLQSVAGTPNSYTIISVKNSEGVTNTENLFNIANNGDIILLDNANNANEITYILKVTATNSYGTSKAATVKIIILPEPIYEFNERKFELRNPFNTRNIKGDYQFIGNTVLCVQSNNRCYDYTGSLANNQLDLKYIDIDSTTNTFNNSSQATIDIPDNAVIKWAALYSQGHLTNQNATNSKRILADPIKLTVPGIQSTIDVFPQYTNLLEYSGGHTYATVSVIYELEGKLGSLVNGAATVANIKAYEGTESSGLGNYGAWTLVIVYEDKDSTLKNISIYDGYRLIKDSTGRTIPISGFLTPTQAGSTINSKISIFVGEGDKNIEGDKLSFNGTSIGYKESNGDNNAFHSSTNGYQKNPDYSNNQGIDIQNYNVGTDGLDLVKAGDTSADIKFTSTGDYYYPSAAAFSTDLYEPRVCYNQAFFAEDGSELSDVSVGDTVLVKVWISNMKKIDPDTGLPEEGDLETADKVEVTLELDQENLEYTGYNNEYGDIFKLNNVNDSDISVRTNTVGDDEIDFDTDTLTATWRVGDEASATDGGQLKPNTIPTEDLKSFIEFKVKLVQEGENTTINNLYYVSYENSQLGQRFGDLSPFNIEVCAEFDSSISISGLLGAFNIVNESGGGSDFLDPTSAQTSLSTQVANRNFNTKIISLNAAGNALLTKSDDLNISLINYPYSSCNENDTVCQQNACDNAIPLTSMTNVHFDGTTQMQQFNFVNAYKNVMFKIDFDGGSKHACSLDSFSIRPDKFILTPPTGEDMKLLSAGSAYNFSLTAIQDTTATKTNGYTISNVDSTTFGAPVNKYLPDGTIDNTLNGTLTFAQTPFNIVDGISYNGTTNEVVDMSYDDVGIINIKLEDTTWAQVDIDNGDTPQDCTALGAYICGDINATFIPDHFTLTNVELHNSNDSDFTYLSNDLNQSANISLTARAENAGNGPTLNFRNTAWENPVDITFVAPNINGDGANKIEIDTPLMLNFNSSAKTTLEWDETNTSKQLKFNYPRAINNPKNPSRVNGTTEINVLVKSTYNGTAGATKDVTGASTATDTATFVYGRTHAPRQRFIGNTGNIIIYYESYCNIATGCDKSLLPDLGLNAKYSDDPRWFINTSNTTTTTGTVGTITQKYVANVSEHGAATLNNAVTTVPLIYGTGANPAPQGYPYKGTMENNASSWLIYHPFIVGATTNEFEVEFDNTNSSWAGVTETNTSTNSNAASKTNRRSMW